jgi:hypothetical protein
MSRESISHQWAITKPDGKGLRSKFQQNQSPITMCGLAQADHMSIMRRWLVGWLVGWLVDEKLTSFVEWAIDCQDN